MGSVCNGIDVSELLSTFDEIRKDPAKGLFNVRVRSDWVSGFHCRQTVVSSAAAGSQSIHPKHHSADTDLPPILQGGDEGLWPSELLLASIGGCLAATFVAHASAMGIRLEALQVEVCGEGDIAGFLGIGPGRPGFTSIHAKLVVRSREPRDRLEDLHRYATSHSPVWSAVTSRVAADSRLVLETDDLGAVTLLG
ncbi:MAG: OsmC family protein [Fimbriimonadales bacterium]|nr:OsmC family protein [Fimbriimonadales bacterium]